MLRVVAGDHTALPAPAQLVDAVRGPESHALPEDLVACENLIGCVLQHLGVIELDEVTLASPLGPKCSLSFPSNEAKPPPHIGGAAHDVSLPCEHRLAPQHHASLKENREVKGVAFAGQVRRAATREDTHVISPDPGLDPLDPGQDTARVAHHLGIKGPPPFRIALRNRRRALANSPKQLDSLTKPPPQVTQIPVFRS